MGSTDPDTLYQCVSGVYQECIRHVSEVYQKGVFFLHADCLRSFAIPLGHLRDFIVYLWDIISCGILVVFCGTLVDFRTCLVVPLNVLGC